jgi:3alpha(or 20beta)-hydroxysteroid dehydrogenase
MAIERGWYVHGVDLAPRPPDIDAHEWSQLDLADTASRAEWISAMVRRGDSFGGAILAAGIMSAETQDGWDELVWRRTLEIDLVAPAHLVFGLGQLWEPHAGIVLFGSIAAVDGTLGSPAYAAAKAGLIGIMGAAIRRFADREVRVNVVHPGSVDTPLSRRMLDELPDSVRAQMPTLNRRGMRPDYVSHLAVELVEAYGISGEAIRVDRGARILPGVSPGPDK